MCNVNEWFLYAGPTVATSDLDMFVVCMNEGFSAKKCACALVYVIVRVHLSASSRSVASLW